MRIPEALFSVLGIPRPIVGYIKSRVQNEENMQVPPDKSGVARTVARDHIRQPSKFAVNLSHAKKNCTFFADIQRSASRLRVIVSLQSKAMLDIYLETHANNNERESARKSLTAVLRERQRNEREKSVHCTQNPQPIAYRLMQDVLGVGGTKGRQSFKMNSDKKSSLALT